jgi:hypothetical protein
MLTPEKPGNGFLEALTRDNVKAFTQQMQRITEKGFVDRDGKEHEGKSEFYSFGVGF